MWAWVYLKASAKDKDVNSTSTLVLFRREPFQLGFLDYTRVQPLNKLFAKGLATYEILIWKSSIIDIY